MKHLFAFATSILLGACGGHSPDPATEVSATTARPSVPPAIIPPHEVADPTQPPSYEVAIAGAAAEHNTAKDRCAKQPEAVRAQCEQEANAAFSDARGDLERLRGNQN